MGKIGIGGTPYWWPEKITQTGNLIVAAMDKKMYEVGGVWETWVPGYQDTNTSVHQ